MQMPKITLIKVDSYHGNCTEQHKQTVPSPSLFSPTFCAANMSENDNAWVFDSLVCFLNGPIWNAPLQSFIEEKSLIFEPGVADENEYQKVFEEFKNLVDFMLGNFMEDIGITPEQFEEACNRENHEPIPVQFDQNLFEQIWAANDYEIFKRLMTQRNVELQLQALELLEQKYGIKPESFRPHKSDEKTEREMKNTASVLEKEALNTAAKKLATEQTPTELKTILEDEKVQLKEKLKSLDDAKEKATKPPPVAKKPAPQPDALEIKKRQEYLRQQRDKLVALKKEARKQQLDVETSEKPLVRPKSAKAAEKILVGEAAGKIDAQQLQIRRSLAERLRNKVVNKE